MMGSFRFSTCMRVLVIAALGMGTAAAAFGQNQPSTKPIPPDRPTPTKRPSTAPLPEKRSVVPAKTDAPKTDSAAATTNNTKPAGGTTPPAAVPAENCAKGTAAAGPVGAHVVIPPGKAPKAVCEKESIEAEPVWKGQTMTCNYTVRNEGDADLFIRAKAT